MSASPSSSAQQARRAIGRRLRDILRDSGITARALAHAAGWDESKCSRLINGRTLPSDDDIRVWCRICNAENEIPDLIAATRDADSMYVEWRRLQRSGMRRLQETRVSLYEETRLFRFYCSQFMPWPLQTPGYMRAVLSAFADFHDAPRDIDEAIAARSARSRLLYEGDHRFAMVMEESVLHDRIADDDVMAGQLGQLLEGMSLPSVSLGIIPSGTRRKLWTMETFSIYDDKRVFVELLSAGVTVTQPREIALYLKGFSELAGQAVYGNKARSLITAAIGALS
ncbi:transcriptional regulator with XRE-family HTH domain [Streptosporangium becharense]|uniref:Transcriptional regulator with XRE-family HTH domain n=1 Tax=Streptosporangium becharense TaxID=1816182 RepID=A0A7W9ICC3_9ACTN|nr:helix-turn-helix transcriptional regulator [Streptosporangium becharense]MBB2915053.1 transcriptional regulator with XRE-family HTH domain [Streptosporangium becharense]MBB5818102.1 transcriptional regulator with XRE-family HTH domain [Streptosporangium becharense]